MSSTLPPGLQGPADHVISGGSAEWQPITQIKLFTNAFVFADEGRKVLLGYKKRGFGKDMWNGFGGKVEPGETSLEGAKRELREEAGIDAPLEHAGTLVFITVGTPYAFHIEYYRADTYTGMPTETDEMRPAWFSTSPSAVATVDNQRSADDDGPLPGIPYAQMWQDDEHWFPLLFARRHFIGRADVDKVSGVYNMQRFWFGATQL